MAGINALPRWDPSNPTTYRYDWKHYDPADYAAFKEARLAHNQKAMAEARARSKEVMKEVNRAIKEKLKEAKQLNKNGASREQIEQWAKAGKRLYADVPSSCFEQLSWRADPDGDGTEGTVTGTFYHGGALTYSGPLSLDEFMEATSGSLGEWYAETKPF